MARATAHAFVDEIHGNVDDWYADRIDHDTFSARQRAIWSRIDASQDDVRDDVLKAIRDRMR